MSETVNCNKVIKTCEYNFEVSGKYYYCDYLCRTGKIRTCAPEKCNVYSKKPKDKARK